MSRPCVPPGRHVYLVRSSLQFLLASALAQDQRERDGGVSRMLFLPDVLEPDLFSRAIQGWETCPFDQIVQISPRRAAGNPSHRRQGALVRRELRGALADAQPLSLTVFNDREEASQTLLIEAARRFPRALRRCAEDGALAYTGYTYRPHGRFVRWRQRLRLGSAWADVRVLGTHPLTQQYVALYPALLRPELRGRAVQPLPASAFASEALRELTRRFCEAASFDPAGLPAGAAVITLSHSDYARRNPDYLGAVVACVAGLRARHVPVFLKHHPRETVASLLGDAAAGTLEVPRTLPVECLWLQLREQRLQVIGGMSTSLLTAALLMPQARVQVLRHASFAGDTWDPTLLAALKIEDAACPPSTSH